MKFEVNAEDFNYLTKECNIVPTDTVNEAFKQIVRRMMDMETRISQAQPMD